LNGKNIPPKVAVPAFFVAGAGGLGLGIKIYELNEETQWRWLGFGVVALGFSAPIVGGAYLIHACGGGGKVYQT